MKQFPRLICVWLFLLAVQLPVTVMGQTSYATPYTFTTLAGLAGNNHGTNDGTGSAARFNNPFGIAVDSSGVVYVVDSFNDTIRKVTPEGVVTTLAGLAGSTGTNDGTGSAARFFSPSGLAVDGAGNIYVGDSRNSAIRKVTPAGVVTTLAGLPGTSGTNDGTGGAARFSALVGLAVDSGGNVYVADKPNSTIRMVTPAGVVTTLAGLPGISGTNDGTGSGARFNQPYAVAVGTNGNVYVADTGNHTIRQMTPVGTNWAVTTPVGLAGSVGTNDGTGNAARFDLIYGMAMDTNSNIYVVDRGYDTLRKITPVGTNWVVTTLAGLSFNQGNADGTGSTARFLEPEGVTVDTNGNVYVADTGNNTIRKGFLASTVTSPVLNSPGVSAGQFGFGITGIPGLAVDVMSSTNLSTWQVVATNILNGGSNYFVVTNQAQGLRFYRTHVR